MNYGVFQTTDQKVGGLNPFGITYKRRNSIEIQRVALFLLSYFSNSSTTY